MDGDLHQEIEGRIALAFINAIRTMPDAPLPEVLMVAERMGVDSHPIGTLIENAMRANGDNRWGSFLKPGKKTAKKKASKKKAVKPKDLDLRSPRGRSALDKMVHDFIARNDDGGKGGVSIAAVMDGLRMKRSPITASIRRLAQDGRIENAGTSSRRPLWREC